MEPNYRPVQSPDQPPRSRGFTLVELMVVVVIITALSALAIPSVLRQMRDRRTRQAAEEIASVYRQARLRALGRGAAVMVSYTSASGFQIREAVLGGAGACSRLPSTNCATTLWGQGQNVPNGDQLIDTFNPVSGVYAGVTVAVYAADPAVGGSATISGSGLGSLDICFTPMGRSQYRTTAGNVLSPMTGIQVITVKRDTPGLMRLVVIPPNGLARTDVSQ